jgi:hypothetical protein
LGRPGPLREIEMKFKYEVKAEIEFTGQDLLVLEYHSKRHYDGACQRFFAEAPHYRDTVDHEGCYWLREWQWQEWKSRNPDAENAAEYTEESQRRPEENLEFAVTVTVSSRSMDLCLKIIERLGSAESWKLIGELMGREMPQIEQTMALMVVPLRLKLRTTFRAIQTEWNRLDEAQNPAPKLDGAVGT